MPSIVGNQLGSSNDADEVWETYVDEISGEQYYHRREDNRTTWTNPQNIGVGFLSTCSNTEDEYM